MDVAAKLERIAQLSREAASAGDASRFLNSAVAALRQAFSCRSVAVVLASEESEMMTIRSASGISESAARDFRRPAGTGLVAEVLRGRASVLCNRLEPGSPELAEFTIEHVPVSLMCVRIEADSRSLGYLLGESDRKDAFGETDLQMFRVVAGLAALALARGVATTDRGSKLVMTDPLTQVCSYPYFHRRLSDEVERAERLSEPLSVLLVEIDGLKEYRETNGWQATEQVLCDVVKIVSSSVRNIDVVGRYGAAAVILYLPETAREKACLAAERIRAVVEKGAKTTPTGLTVSVGLASLPENGDTVNRLLESVTAALLAAERAGRNRVQCASTD